MQTGRFKCRMCGDVMSMEFQAKRSHFRCIHCLSAQGMIQRERRKIREKTEPPRGRRKKRAAKSFRVSCVIDDIDSASCVVAFMKGKAS